MDECKDPTPAPRPVWKPLSGAEIMALIETQKTSPVWQVGTIGSEDLEAQ